MTNETTAAFWRRGADQAHLRDRAQPRRRVGEQIVLVGGDGVEAETGDVVDRGAEADDPGDVRRARLELGRAGSL